ncbi:methylenetetrahydrofolate reductase [Luteococcus peritonei]|uniref:Methylenetetrahydrofolate reductase n=1 Tax=Luteococcus peritonei TaxID=88874 RepID=A0ABW4RRX5_9ACTN
MQTTAPGRDGMLLFALTPPRQSTSPERAAQIADATLARLEQVSPDAVLLYDITDEADRTDEERPFPFLPTMDPGVYWERHFDDCRFPVVVYRAVGHHAEPVLRDWLGRQDASRVRTVFVGGSSSDRAMATTLPRAYELLREVNPDLPLGGVAIPERHTSKRSEHHKLLRKQQAGCSFFVTQIVYDVNAAKNMVSDYRVACAEAGVQMVPVVFTFSVAGSLKTLEFMRWLGVEVPHWIENDMASAADPLAISLRHALGAVNDIVGYCRLMGIPFGINVESVSSRKVEIDAAVELAGQVDALLREG